MLLQTSKRNLTYEAGCGLLGLWSDRPRIGNDIGNDVSAVFRKFLPDVGWSFCVAGAVIGEFGR